LAPYDASPRYKPRLLKRAKDVSHLADSEDRAPAAAARIPALERSAAILGSPAEVNEQNNKLSRRNQALDGLRGWLSIVVCFYHGILIPQGQSIFLIFEAPLSQTTSIPRKMILEVINGDLAVSVFFVMSGAVLFGSLSTLVLKQKPVTLVLDFTLRRIFRLFPALIFALTTFAGAYLILESIFPQIFHVYFNLHQFFLNIFLLKIEVYGASWSLQVELEAVPYVLLGFWVWRRLGGYGLFLYLALALMASHAPWLTLNLPNLDQNLFLFVLGMLAIGPFGQAITRDINDRAVIMILIMLILGASVINYMDPMTRQFQGLIATIFVAALINGRLPVTGKWLSTALSQFLGRISYSFYVINPIFLEFIRPIIGHAPNWTGPTIWSELLLGASATICSIPLSALCYRYIEIPGIRAGKAAVPTLERLYTRIGIGSRTLRRPTAADR
jgi:peptidoglycan/LPS O-acetylase OafA/YrhL